MSRKSSSSKGAVDSILDSNSEGSSTFGSTATSLHGSKIRDLEDQIFSVLFTLTQHGKSGKVVPFVAFTIDFIQMLGFVMSSNFPWGTATRDAINGLFSAFQLRVPTLAGKQYSSFIYIFWIVITIVGLAMLDVVWVGKMFKKNEFRYIWPIKFLRMFVSLLVSVLFIPLFNVLLFPLDCVYTSTPPMLDEFPDIQCWSPLNAVHSAVAIISAVVFSLFSLTVALVYVDPDPTKNSPLATPHSFFDVILLISRIALSLFTTFISQHTQWLAIINFLVHMTCFVAVNALCPYFSLTVTRLRSGFFAVLSYAACILLVVVRRNDETSDTLTYVLIAGAIPIFALGHFLPLWRLKQLDARRYLPSLLEANAETTASKSSAAANRIPTAGSGGSGSGLEATKRLKETVLSVQNVELLARESDTSGADPESKAEGDRAEQKKKIAFVKAYNFKKDFEIELATRFLQEDGGAESKEAARAVYERGMALFPASPLLLLSFASFAQFYLKDLQLAQSLVEKANLLNPFFGFRFLLYRKRKETFKRGGADDVISAVDFKKNYKAARKFHTVCVRAMIQLWRTLLPNKVNVILLPELLERIYKSEERADLHFKHLLKKYKNPRTLRAYGAFLADCKNNHSLAQRYFAAAEEMEEDEREQTGAGNIVVSPNGSVKSFGGAAPATSQPQQGDLNAMFDISSTQFRTLPIILLDSNGNILSISETAQSMLAPCLSFAQNKDNQKFANLLTQHSAALFSAEMNSGAGFNRLNDGMASIVSTGFMLLSCGDSVEQVFPMAYRLVRTTKPNAMFSVCFGTADVSEACAWAELDRTTMVIENCDESLASMYGATPEAIIGSSASEFMSQFADQTTLELRDGSFTTSLAPNSFHLLTISQSPGQPSRAEVFIYSLSTLSTFPGDEPQQISQIPPPDQNLQQQQSTTLRRTNSFGSKVSFSIPAGSVVKNGGVSGNKSVASGASNGSRGAGAGAMDMGDDAEDLQKKSTVYILHRNIAIALIVMAAFAIASYATVDALTGQTKVIVQSVLDAGTLSTYTQRIATYTRTIQLDYEAGNWAEIPHTQAFVLELAEGFFNKFYEVYYRGDQLKYQPLKDIYYNPSIPIAQLNTDGNVTHTLIANWVVGRMYELNARWVAMMPQWKFGGILANSSFYFVAENGPWSVKDAMADLMHVYKEYSFSVMSQIKVIEGCVQSASIAVLIALVFVVQFSLSLVHKDKIRSINLFLIVPKSTIADLLNRQFYIIQETQALENDNEQSLPPIEFDQTAAKTNEVPHVAAAARAISTYQIPDEQIIPPSLPPIPSNAQQETIYGEIMEKKSSAYSMHDQRPRLSLSSIDVTGDRGHHHHHHHHGHHHKRSDDQESPAAHGEDKKGQLASAMKGRNKGMRPQPLDLSEIEGHRSTSKQRIRFEGRGATPTSARGKKSHHHHNRKKSSKILAISPRLQSTPKNHHHHDGNTKKIHSPITFPKTLPPIPSPAASISSPYFAQLQNSKIDKESAIRAWRDNGSMVDYSSETPKSLLAPSTPKIFVVSPSNMITSPTFGATPRGHSQPLSPFGNPSLHVPRRRPSVASLPRVSPVAAVTSARVRTRLMSPMAHPIKTVESDENSDSYSTVSSSSVEHRVRPQKKREKNIRKQKETSPKKHRSESSSESSSTSSSSSSSDSSDSPNVSKSKFKKTKNESKKKKKSKKEKGDRLTRSTDKRLERSLASTVEKRMSVKYLSVVVIIGAFLITSFVLGFNTIDEVVQTCVELDLASTRNYLTSHVRHMAREYVISPTAAIRTHILSTTALLQQMHGALLYGSAELGVKLSALRYMPQENLMFQMSCNRLDKTQCPKPGDPYYEENMAPLGTLIRDYLENYRRLVSLPTSELSFNNEVFMYVWDRVFWSVRDGLQISTELYLQESVEILTKSVNTQLYLMLAVLLLLVFLYLAVFRPMIRFIREETKRTCSMLLMLPRELVESVEEIRQFVAEKQVEILKNNEN